MQKIGRDLKYNQKFVVPHTTARTVTALGNSGLCPCSNTTLSLVPRRLSAQGQTDHTCTGEGRFKQPATYGGADGECSTVTHYRHLSWGNLLVSRWMMQAITSCSVSRHFSEKKRGGGIRACGKDYGCCDAYSAVRVV